MGRRALRPPDDERSNYRLARENLLDRLRRSRGEVHRIRGELGAEAAADEYDAELAGRRLELVLLGLGPDGHTASLFPNAPALEERERRAVPAEAGLEPFVERVTMTVPVLASAPDGALPRHRRGEGGGRRSARSRGRPTRRRPPAWSARTAARTRVVLDRAAAARLPD